MSEEQKSSSLTPEMIEAGAVAMANFDVSLVGCPILKGVEDFRFDKDRDEYLRRSEIVLNAAITAWNTRAGERVRAEIARDSERLDWLESSCCDVRFRSEPIADTGDADVYCDIMQHHMSDPKERVIGSRQTIRAAIDAARNGSK